MLISRLAVVLPLFAFAGCWPYLGGPYEDYVDGEGSDDLDTSDRDTSDRDTSDRDTDPDDPDTTVPGDGPTLFGVFTNIQFMGSYWGENANNGVQSTFIVAGEPGLGWTLGSTYPAPNECSSGGTLGNDANSLGINAGLPSSFTVGTSGRLFDVSPWEDNPRVRVGNNTNFAAIPSNADVTIATQVDDGTVDGVFTRTPSNFQWTDPPVDGTNIVSLPREPFNVQWEGAGSDMVVATWLFQDGDFENLAGALCTVSGSSFSIDPDAAPAGTEFVQIRLERIREYSGTVPGTAGVESVVAGSLEKRGYVALQPE